MGSLAGVTFRPDDNVLSRFDRLFGATPADRALSLAQAWATSPPWVTLAQRARIVVRAEPVATICVVGRFVEADRAAVEALGWQVTDTLARLRPVPYSDVERACRQLGERLLARLGEERLRSCQVVAMPRGGLVVAGLLAYSLGLTHDQLAASTSQSRETLLVDDCMLSGARTRRWLRDHQGQPVVLAHLHSHPAVRERVEQHPQVSACIAAEDLHDYAPEQQGDRYDVWRTAWQQRSPDDFWTGHPDHVCYPWNEPDTSFWNAATGAAEAGWHVVPPAWCVKNRARLREDDVQVCASSHVPAGVLWAYLDDAVVLVDTSRGTSLEISGTGVDFWRELTASGDVALAAETLTATYAVDRSVLLTDLESFAAQLRDGGWWEPGSAA